jgi:hypothetical protein
MRNAVWAVGNPRQLAAAEDEATVRFGETAKKQGAGGGSRVIFLGDAPAFELSFWCGTCLFLFERQAGANQTVSLEVLQARLADWLSGVDEEVVGAFGELLGEDEYVPLLIEMSPVMVEPSDSLDYFSHESVATWGRNGFWGLPEYPQTPYYRTFQTAVDADTHLYEFVVPMVPPSWNESDQVEKYVQRIEEGGACTAVAVSTLDVCQPATEAPDDYYTHWGLSHFLLDGHHKVEAAARAGHTITLLSLLARGASLAEPHDLSRLTVVRNQPASSRP